MGVREFRGCFADHSRIVCWSFADASRIIRECFRKHPGRPRLALETTRIKLRPTHLVPPAFRTGVATRGNTPSRRAVLIAAMPTHSATPAAQLVMLGVPEARSAPPRALRAHTRNRETRGAPQAGRRPAAVRPPMRRRAAVAGRNQAPVRRGGSVGPGPGHAPSTVRPRTAAHSSRAPTTRRRWRRRPLRGAAGCPAAAPRSGSPAETRAPAGARYLAGSRGDRWTTLSVNFTFSSTVPRPCPAREGPAEGPASGRSEAVRRCLRGRAHAGGPDGRARRPPAAGRPSLSSAAHRCKMPPAPRRREYAAPPGPSRAPAHAGTVREDSGAGQPRPARRGRRSPP